MIAPEKPSRGVLACALLFLLASPAITLSLEAPRPSPLRHRAKQITPMDPNRELADIIITAKQNDPNALARLQSLMRRVTGDPQWRRTARKTFAIPEDPDDVRVLAHLFSAYRYVEKASIYARGALGNAEYDDAYYAGLLLELGEAIPDDQALRVQAEAVIEAAREEGEALQSLRTEIFDQYIGETRKGVHNPDTRFAWSLVRLGIGMPEALVDPASFKYDLFGAEIELVHEELKARIRLNAADQGKRIRAHVDAYAFTAGWAVLIQKPLRWMLVQAEAMREAGVQADPGTEWMVLEAPDGLISLAFDSGEAAALPLPVPKQAFYRGRLRQITPFPAPRDAASANAAFSEAAKALRDGVMTDTRIPQPLRQALRPVLEGTYLPIDPRDYFDNDFCRRLIEADYLETYIKPMPPERAAELAAYRQALARLEAGYDRFAVDLGGGDRLVAVAHADVAAQDDEMRLDPETGEAMAPFEWRLEEDAATAFHSPLPARQLYALSLVERYEGTHRLRPRGVPAVTEVWHPVIGLVASYRDGDETATGNEDDWLAAATLDCRGRLDTTSEPLGWNYPFHVLQRDDQGDPVLLATLHGIVESPDFPPSDDTEQLRRAEDAWLDHAARILREPGELGLIFHHFFRYCSDSPLPELPNLIGSHYGLSDTHQTVYQSLERRWVGRLIGDCDDLAEFFQELTERQGKLSHVMQVPAHAAAGFAERADDGQYRFVVLQTGPVLQFTAPGLYEAVEKAYRSFDSERGNSHITAAAVPILLRFADEDTRTPFVLPVRIYEDREYAQAMIRVQGHWHLYAFSSAIEEMERMLLTDRQVGNLKELASLYEQVGNYEAATALREEELEAARPDKDAFVSTLLEIANLHVKNKDRPAAAETLAELESALRILREADPGAYARTLPFRYYWAILQARYGDPARSWDLLRSDAADHVLQSARLPEYLMTPLVMVYERVALNLEKQAVPDEELEETLLEMEELLEVAFVEGYFRSDDSYNRIMSRYNLLGRYAVAAEGRAEGIRILAWNGPYPEGGREHAARRRAVTGSDWEWFRIVPDLYLGLALEMLDADDAPELYDPDRAKTLLLAVSRAAEKGAGLGSDVVGAESVIKADLILAFLGNDREAFERITTLVREKNYASLYDDAAQAFGNHCGLVPAAEFPAWIDGFHRSFPGRQHYFKAVYRMLDKEFFDHALMLAEATLEFFPDDPLLAAEAAYVAQITPRLREEAARRERTGSGSTAEPDEHDAEEEAIDATEESGGMQWFG